MERNCMIHAWRGPSAPLSQEASGFCLFFPASTLESIWEAWPP